MAERQRFLPVASNPHPQRGRGDGGSFAAQDARTESDGAGRGRLRIASRSVSSKPPSGPIRSAAFVAFKKARPASSPPSSSAKKSVRSAGQSARRRASGTGSVSAGNAVRAHCSAASVTIARARSALSLSATHRRVTTGRISATPSSVAFSRTMSKRSFLSSAGQSQRSGTASRLRRCSTVSTIT